MEQIGLLLSVCNLPLSLFFTLAKITGGHFIFKFLMRFCGILSLVTSFIYILKYVKWI